MTENINWDLFPHPYNQELPHYIDLAYQRLTPVNKALRPAHELWKHSCRHAERNMARHQARERRSTPAANRAMPAAPWRRAG
jgi:hypothetical protein